MGGAAAERRRDQPSRVVCDHRAAGYGMSGPHATSDVDARAKVYRFGVVWS